VFRHHRERPGADGARRGQGRQGPKLCRQGRQLRPVDLAEEGMSGCRDELRSAPAGQRKSTAGQRQSTALEQEQEQEGGRPSTGPGRHRVGSHATRSWGALQTG